jgi:DNA-binding transcriptional ArsR family regulator
MENITMMASQTARLVEELLCSKVRIKIIKLLDDLGQLNVSDIAHRLHINYQTTMKHLSILEDSKIVEPRLCGRTRSFRLSGSPRAQAIRKLLQAWEREK